MDKLISLDHFQLYSVIDYDILTLLVFFIMCM